MLGEVVPPDEEQCTRHLLRLKLFEKKLFHKLLSTAATLEAELVRVDLTTKEATTSIQQHFQHEFVNAARAVYTKVLLEGGNPKVQLLATLPPPPHF